MITDNLFLIVYSLVILVTSMCCGLGTIILGLKANTKEQRALFTVLGLGSTLCPMIIYFLYFVLLIHR